MGYAYTPGLTVAAHTVVRKVRRLPLKGEVRVKVGQRVQADEVVAQTFLPGKVEMVNVVGKLGIQSDDLSRLMLKKQGETVKTDEVFVQTKGMFGMFKTDCRSPIDGTIEQISAVTGQVVIRGQPTALQKTAYAAGTIVETQDAESATVEVAGTYVQGIFGIGGEELGPLEVVAKSPDDVLKPDVISAAHKGKIIVGGSLVTAEAVKQAAKVGAKGIICGGLDDADLRDFLGYELGVAITGEETLGVTVVVTEGFGRIRMAKATFELLQKRQGLLTSINGATQIRAGVIRPEVLIPLDQKPVDRSSETDEDSILKVGTSLRAIRDPYFGLIGRCTALPVELVKLTSETKVRVLEVEFEDGRKAILPRANVELIKQ